MKKSERYAARSAFDFIEHTASDYRAEPVSVAGSNGRSQLNAGVKARISTFPRTRYYGSKRRLLDWIYENIKELEFTSVLDGFGGTASVSLLFKAMNKAVTFHDALCSNTISATALLAQSTPPNYARNAFSYFEKIEQQKGFISKTFEGLYYKKSENAWLDGAINAIGEIESPAQRALYLHCVFQACLMKRPFNLFHRANLNLRTRKLVARSFGNFRTWERPFVELIKGCLLEHEKLVWRSARTPIVLDAGDIFDIPANYDLVYLDPPYISSNHRRGDDYLRRYHFLEGIALYADWPNAIDPSSKIKCINPREHVRQWDDEVRHRDLLFNLINKHRKSIVILSYVAGAYPSGAELYRHFQQQFKTARQVSKKVNHALAAGKKTELLFIGIP